MCVCVSVGCGEYYTLLMYCTRAGIGLFFFPTTGRDERQINEELCTQTQCALLLLDDTMPPSPQSKWHNAL
jgi:hypothetical protein